MMRPKGNCQCTMNTFLLTLAVVLQVSLGQAKHVWYCSFVEAISGIVIVLHINVGYLFYISCGCLSACSKAEEKTGSKNNNCTNFFQGQRFLRITIERTNR